MQKNSDIEKLAVYLGDRIRKLGAGEKFWLGIAGAPGSGKSTLAGNLQRRLGRSVVIVPMDGYHYRRAELDAMDDPRRAHARRGAPFTFDGERFVREMIRAKEVGRGSFPSFDHGSGDPIEDAIVLSETDTSIVIIEGNYLLLDDEPWCRLHTKVFDENWFLDVDVDVCMKRILARHIATGKSEDIARSRVELNDALNANLVGAVSKENADRVIRLEHC